MTPFLDEQFHDLKQELKITEKSKSQLRNKILQKTVIVHNRDYKNTRSWYAPILTAILTIIVMIFLATQSLDTLRQAAHNMFYSNDVVVPTEVKIMEKIIVQDYIEFTIQSNNFGKNIYPTNSGPTSNYLNNGNKDEIYLDILVTVRNLSSTELSESDDFMDIKIICDEREELNSFTSFERKSYEDVQENKFSISNNSIIEPSQTRVVHFLTSVPTSVEKDGKPLKAIITANGENYEYIIR
ncbi:hypothetical protein B857_00591 [Solibacillus isronensis B3W22]|uniref:Uncharacterized protein n=1 Tax=Solibacillus isronensis B3W22 TaxID=1224748 RepID=K1KV37_9BACL|nr:hypothetical protein [Solibacillus isronensis]AMO85732.1 hypothetical protein SOLI23_09070 [Solibacillus silvestris]EKB46381.1 hypothetical protein B857_00591 [Solibacillus isronensis B3W22]